MIVACVSCGASTDTKCKDCGEPLCYMCKPIGEGLLFTLHLHYTLDTICDMIIDNRIDLPSLKFNN